MRSLLLLLLVTFNLQSNCFDVDIDPNGYIVYCPCMGRFGNQAEQFLGTIQFAKSLDRTLVLPPFVEYRHFNVNLVAYDDYIQLEPIKKYHKVILMSDFMDKIAPDVWPEETRSVVCYSPRPGLLHSDCNPFEGSPFRPFWHHFDIKQFKNGSLFHSPLTTDYTQAQHWIEKFKNVKVLAFVGAPSSFPTNEEATKIQKYINFSDKLTEIAKAYRETRGFSRTPYLAVHLRHGTDWAKACNLLKENPNMRELFSSKQCTTFYKVPDQKLSVELCFPSLETIIKQIKDVVEHSQNPHKINTVYIGTDHDDTEMWKLIHSSLPSVRLITPTITIESTGQITHHSPPTPLIDAYLMTFSNHFIGNCISSFSAFVSRLRIFNFNFIDSTEFFSSDSLLKDSSSQMTKDEL